MANICENKIYLSTPLQETYNEFKEIILKTLHGDVSWEDCDDGMFQLEAYFESNWDFPKSIMKEITDNLTNTQNLYIRVLSIEECNYYAAYNVFEDGVWVLK